MTKVEIALTPSGKKLAVEIGSRLRTALAPCDVEFACDGQSECGSCRVQVLEGVLPVTPQDVDVFRPDELAAGWRLACQAVATGQLQLRCGQPGVEILGDRADGKSSNKSGYGVAVDLGSTTIVAQLLELSTGRLVAERSALNPQAAWGTDVMTRIRYAVSGTDLTDLIRHFLGKMIIDLSGSHRDQVNEIVLAGNTVMHHLFCGLNVEPLSHVPFSSEALGEYRFSPRQLNWPLCDGCAVRFLPCIGGFVGSDVMSGIRAVGMDQTRDLIALIDLGTNGQIAIGNRDRIICASTAAGSAFEAGSIKMGMRASNGAISRVLKEGSSLRCKVIGGGAARGICGSGLVDAVAAILDLGLVDIGGRLSGGRKSIELQGEVELFQADIRELQLAKAAIAAGVRLLLKHYGVSMDSLQRVYLAGAFGNYISPTSGSRIGLLEMPVERIFPAGNTALRGTKIELATGSLHESGCTEHFNLASDPDFQDTFVTCMAFPSNAA